MIDFLNDHRTHIDSPLDYDERREVDGKLIAVIKWLEGNPNIEQKSIELTEEMKSKANGIPHKFKVGDIVQYVTDTTDRRRIDEVDDESNLYVTNGSPIMFEAEEDWTVIVDAEENGLTEFEEALADICRGWIGEEIGWEDYITKNSIPLLELAKKQMQCTAEEKNWKPTKVQLDCLKEACDKRFDVDGLDPLYMLYEQLKTL